MAPEDHPLWIARTRCVPAHRTMGLLCFDGVRRLLEVTAIPLIGQSGRMLGAFAVFWEKPAT